MPSCLTLFLFASAATLQGMPDSLSPEPSPTPLLDIVGNKAIPWIEKGGMQRVVIARASHTDIILPAGVRVSQKKLVSRPTSIRGRRIYGSANRAKAHWVEDDQETTDFSSLVCVIDGHADLQIGDYVLHCPVGTFIFIAPGLPHPRGERSHLEGKNRAGGSCDLLWFSQRGRQVQCWICFSRGEKHEVPRGHENVFLGNDRILHSLNTLEEEAARCDADHEKMFERALNMLLIATHRDLQAGHFLQRPDEYGESNLRSKKGQDPIVLAQEYIKSHLARPLTVEMVANAVYMSETHFRRRFRAETGYTLTAFINFHRLEQAQHFLRDTDWSVSQVREFIGYRSDAYLHTLFRRHFNMSPTEFRNKCLPKESGKTASEGARPRKKAH